MDAPRLSIILISWNSLPMLSACLQSLGNVTCDRGVEIIWVDNGSEDGAKEFVAERYPGVKQIILPSNMGVAYARNRGLEAARGRYLLLLDDDTEASPEVLGELEVFMEAHPSVGICAATLVNKQGEVQESLKPYPGLLCKISNVIKSRFQSLQPSGIVEVKKPCYVIGACQFIRRECLEQTGMLDQKIFYGPEDADFCIRARKKGWGVELLPHTRIVHHWRRITNRSLTGSIARRHIRALIYFWWKHRRL